MPFRSTRMLVRALDGLAARLLPPSRRAAHLDTGRRGEEEAYFYLRKLGYVMVARNWRSPRRRGELDLVAWDADTLCFIEVKTRSSREVAPAEAAVDADKQRDLVAVAREYLRRLPATPAIRFDVVSIYMSGEGVPAEIALFKGAFGLS